MKLTFYLIVVINCLNIAKSLRRSLSVDGSLSDSLNSDDLMLDIDNDPIDDNKIVKPDTDNLVKAREKNKQNTFNERTSLTLPRY